MSVLYTIGYANKNISDFISILKLNDINCIIDVRTMPFSKQYPDYNESNLKTALNSYGIYYMSFKDEFGARRVEKEAYQRIEMYTGDIVDVVIFRKVYSFDAFLNGVTRVKKGLTKGFNICFLCSEKYAYDCHRCIMISEYFYNQGFNIKHIVDEHNVILHSKIEKYLESNFNEAKQKFERRNKDQIRLLMSGGGLLNDPIPAFVEFWYNFFKKYTREKGFYLRNLEIGYKRGNEEND